jgi:15-cis-phytoene synthase
MEYYNGAEGGIAGLDAAARWPVWSALIVYRNILDAIRNNEYDNITKRAYVPKARKLALLPFSLACAKFPEHASRISRSIPF